jgi:hypothetical protein
MQPENFLKFFWYKTTVFGPVQIPQKSFFEFFSSISKGLCTGTKIEKFNFLILKYSKFKKTFFGVFVPAHIPYYWTLKNF